MIADIAWFQRIFKPHVIYFVSQTSFISSKSGQMHFLKVIWINQARLDDGSKKEKLECNGKIFYRLKILFVRRGSMEKRKWNFSRHLHLLIPFATHNICN